MPSPLRFVSASRPAIMGRVLGIVYRTMATHLNKKSWHDKNHGPNRRSHAAPALRQHAEKIVRRDFQQPQAGPEGVEGRMRGII